MKTPNHAPLIRWLLATCFLAVIVLILAPQASAADSATPALAPAATGNITADHLVQWLTPLLVPLLIAGVKKVLPSVPSWLLPMLAPVLGVLLDVVNSAATGHAGNIWVAALLGLAGVGVREVKDQIKPAAAPATG